MSRKRPDFELAKARILAAHDISTHEWLILDSVRLKIPLLPEELPRFLVGYLSGLPDIQTSVPDLARAVGSLLSRGLLRVISSSDVAAPLPSYSAWEEEMWPSLLGRLDFTETGSAIESELKAAYDARYRRSNPRNEP